MGIKWNKQFTELRVRTLYRRENGGLLVAYCRESVVKVRKKNSQLLNHCNSSYKKKKCVKSKAMV